MKKLEVSAENPKSGVPKIVSGVPSAASYNNDHHSVVHSDTGSVASTSLQGTGVPLSPQRTPPRSIPASPAGAAAAAAVAPSSNAPLRTGNFPAQSPTPRPGPLDLLHSGPQSVELFATTTTTTSHDGYPAALDRSGGLTSTSDDDHTEPSSSATGNTGSQGYTRSDLNPSTISTFGRLIENTKKRLNSGDRRRSSEDEADDDDDDDELVQNALIYGYLQKLGRNGKWQTRWFETDGECLTYYKSSKRSKLLATLDLAKVGSIVMNHLDRNGASFTINISERPYHLRADSVAACKDWVITLNRVKEARMHEGNVKLSLPSNNNHPPDLLDQHYTTPRVVVVANRQRTRAVDDEEIQSWETRGATAPWSNNNNPANEGHNYMVPSSGRLARWQKPGDTFSRLATKLAKWARSIRKFGCADAENHVVLDHHVHPPGHDDKKRMPKSSPSGTKSGGVPGLMTSDRLSNSLDDTTSRQGGADEEDDCIRHLS